jgi:threonyl-tRNA synthetase
VHSDYAVKVKSELGAKGLRVELDLRNEKISYKVREHSHNKIPVILVVGDKEQEQRSVTMRRIGSKDQVSLSLDDAIHSLVMESKAPV